MHADFLKLVMTLHITDRIESGNIEVVDASNFKDVRLRMKSDAHSTHMQWFHFRVAGAKGRALQMSIENAKDASYNNAWKDYRACASYDGESWFRIETTYKNGALILQHTPAYDSVYYAYFAPYSQARHRTFLGIMQQCEGVSLEVLGQTLDQQDLNLVTLGEGEIPCWIIARQHPGESMAEWFVEGLLERLTDETCALSKQLLKRVRFYVIPNMNPDGSVRGHLRTNAAGANLNREWQSPSLEKSPEVFLTLERMKKTGLAFCLDVHGDEELPYNFIAGSDGVEDLPEKIVQARHDYEATLRRVNPDFQSEHGYPVAPKGKANLKMATNQLAHRFKALCMTLEQPFKDNKNDPMLDEGWSPRRAKALGRSQVDALAAVVDSLN